MMAELNGLIEMLRRKAEQCDGLLRELRLAGASREEVEKLLAGEASISRLKIVRRAVTPVGRGSRA